MDDPLFSQGPMEEDIQQEIALFQLEHGFRPSYQIIRKRMQREQSSTPLFDPDHLPSIELKEAMVISLEAIDTLFTWIPSQSPEIQDAVYFYLENPNEENFREILRLLGLKEPPMRKGTSYIQMILDALPRSKEDLIMELGPRIPSKRPAATIRQSLRRLENDGRIRLDEVTNVYQVVLTSDDSEVR